MEQILMKLQETSDKADRNEGRIKKLEGEHDALHKLATSVAVMAEQLKNVDQNVSKLTSEVEEIKEKPAKRWDGLVNNIIWAVVGAVLAFILAKFGF